MSLAPDGHYELWHEIPSPIHVINLARELNVGSILPAAFYDLARYGTSKTASGTEPLPHLILEAPNNENSPTSATRVRAFLFLVRIRPPTQPFYLHPSIATVYAYPLSPSSSLSLRLTSPMLVQDTAPVVLSHEDLVLTFCGQEALQRSVATFLDAHIKNHAPAGMHRRPSLPRCLLLRHAEHAPRSRWDRGWTRRRSVVHSRPDDRPYRVGRRTVLAGLTYVRQM